MLRSSLVIVVALRLAAADVLALVDKHASTYGEASQEIWRFAELGYQEQKSAALLQRHLRDAGFTIETGVAGIPTAFVASWGKGQPVIAILAEYDALPGLSQELIADRKPIKEGAAGHGCGHNLLGAGAALAGVAIREYLESQRLPGTIRVYGTPAEEGGAGKVFMVRAGLFRDVDAVLSWHPGNANYADNGGALANVSGRIRFTGRASHASIAPDRGRSALDGVMLTGMAVEMLREHVPSNARIHYTISDGGGAPNVVPETAELYIYARHPLQQELEPIWERVLKCAQGAPIATDTSYKANLIHAYSSILPNDVLAALADKHLRTVGGVEWTAEESALAEALARTFPPGGPRLPIGSQREVRPISRPNPNGPGGASTDVGDVSWVVPTLAFTAATAVPGTPGHSWQNAVCAGSSIGRKGMVNAAKVIALSARDLLTDANLLKQARENFEAQRAGQQYRSLLPADAKPALGFRLQE